jgi:hypothetical protein
VMAPMERLVELEAANRPQGAVSALHLPS